MGVHVYRYVPMYGCTGVQVYGCTSVWVYRDLGCATAQVDKCLGVHMYSVKVRVHTTSSLQKVITFYDYFSKKIMTFL